MTNSFTAKNTLKTKLLAALNVAADADQIVKISRSIEKADLDDDADLESALDTKVSSLAVNAEPEDLEKLAFGVKKLRTAAGAGTPTSTEVPEGSSNLYVTEDRVRSSFSASGDLSYDSVTGVLSYTALPDALVVYATVADLPASGIAAGAKGIVEENKKLYIFTGASWVSVGLVDQTPSFTIAPEGSYILTPAADTVITLAATDPQGDPLTWSHEVTSGALGGSVVSQADNVFTITGSSDANDTAPFSIAFRVSDGTNIAEGTSEFTISFGSSYEFAGTGNGLTVSGVPALGVDDFTIEFWMKSGVTSNNKNIINTAAGGTGSWSFHLDSSDYFSMQAPYLAGFPWAIQGTPLLDMEWHHVAIVRESGTFAVYFDGVAQTSLHYGSFSSAVDLAWAGDLVIGSGHAGTFNGLLNGMRIVAGSAVYTADFTPPTEVSAAAAGSTMLTCIEPSISASLTTYQQVPVLTGNTVSETKIIVSAAWDDSARGSVYVYDLDGTNEVKIAASDGVASDRFGFSVAAGSDKIAVGSYLDDDNGQSSGSVYIYDLDGTNEVKITASDGAASDYFGSSVAVATNKVVVGTLAGESVYVYDLDGTNEVKITASDGAGDDRFGAVIAVGNDKIVVGSYRDDDNGLTSGSAYVYDLDGTNEVKITASDARAGDQFGMTVAIGNGKIVIGSPYGVGGQGFYIYDLDGTNEVKITANDAGAVGTFADAVAVGSNKIVVSAPSDPSPGTSGAGAVYVYDLDGTNQVKITASDPILNGSFGSSVAVSHDKILVGRYGGGPSGTVYVYDLDGTNEVKITASDGVAADRFGWDAASVAIQVPEYATTSVATKFVTSALNDNSYRGAVYIDNLSGTGQVKITASDGAANDQFGYGVSSDGNYIAVGARGDEQSTGAVYIYDHTAANIAASEFKITASDGAHYDYFGAAVAIGNNKVVVGATHEDLLHPSGNLVQDAGAAYIYDISSSGTVDLSSQVKIFASDFAQGDAFGYSVAIGNNKIAVGAYKHDSRKGAVYIYDLDGSNEVKIMISDAAANDYFGRNVLIADNKLFAGLKDKDNYVGAVYIYDLAAGDVTAINNSEVKIAEVDAWQSQNQFGASIAVANDKLVVGAFAEVSYRGAVYVYDINSDGTVDLTSKVRIAASDGTPSDYFGGSVAIANNKVVVGSDLSENIGGNDQNVGSVYIYDFDGTNEIQIQASDFAEHANFGDSVAALTSTVPEYVTQVTETALTTTVTGGVSVQPTGPS